MIHEKNLKELKTKIETGLRQLDEERESIWNLGFKDFEDLKHAISSYDDLVCEVDCLLTQLFSLCEKIAEELKMEVYDTVVYEEYSSLHSWYWKHFEESAYFRNSDV